VQTSERPAADASPPSDTDAARAALCGGDVEDDEDDVGGDAARFVVIWDRALMVVDGRQDPSSA
jgi:hypothetical protein